MPSVLEVLDLCLPAYAVTAPGLFKQAPLLKAFSHLRHRSILIQPYFRLQDYPAVLHLSHQPT